MSLQQTLSQNLRIFFHTQLNHVKGDSAKCTGCACTAVQAVAAVSSRQSESLRISFLPLCIPRFCCQDLHPTSWWHSKQYTHTPFWHWPMPPLLPWVVQGPPRSPYENLCEFPRERFSAGHMPFQIPNQQSQSTAVNVVSSSKKTIWLIFFVPNDFLWSEMKPYQYPQHKNKL